MPLYEYQCDKCGKVWENLQSLSEPDPKSCPGCRSRRVGRIMSQSTFHLKGTGWYKTDYGSGGSGSKSESGSGSKSESGSGSKSESGSSSKGSDS